MSVVFTELAGQEVDIAKVQKGIRRIVRLTLISIQSHLAASYQTGIFV
jgi:hypothetical protein